MSGRLEVRSAVHWKCLKQPDVKICSSATYSFIILDKLKSNTSKISESL
jgi:hypothetical protein